MNGSRVAHVGLSVALALLFAGCNADDDARDSGAAALRPAPAAPVSETGEDADVWRDVPGRFRRARDAVSPAPLTAEQQELADQLKAIGYLSGSETARGAGVTIHDRTAVQPGLNFYVSGHTDGALLIDMDGKVVHEWRYRSADAFPGSPRPPQPESRDWWRRAHLFPNGDVLAIITGRGILKIDERSQLLWAVPGLAHHDLAVAPNGDIYLLSRRVHVVPRVNPRAPIVEDVVVVLDSSGREKSSLSLLEAFENSDFAGVWQRHDRRTGDLFHTNSIELLDGSAAARNPAFRAGNWLISMRQLDAIAVVDPVQAKVVWAHTGDYRAQHDPKILPNGNLLLFDNHGEHGPSAILEFDLATMDVAWEFRGTPQQPFFTPTCGTAQRLENGNTLISETDFGRTFEVTPAGRIVWEFYNPHRAGDEDQFIASLPEMIRLPADLLGAWLDALPRAAEPGGS